LNGRKWKWDGMGRWLLIDDGPASGSENMARDEFLLDRTGEGSMPPVLRIYRFDPPALSIGFHQNPVKALDIDAVRNDGIDIVRRITGGRALLHDGELTYCIAAPAGSVLFDSGLDISFRMIAKVLVRAFRSVGVGAGLVRGCRPPGRTGLLSPCLSSVSRHEIAAAGRKLVGSAQRRTRSSVLQHGSILMRPASAAIVRYTGGDEESLGRRITSVYEEAGRDVGADEMRASLIEAFEEVFDAEWEAFEFGMRDLDDIERRRLAKAGEFEALLNEEVAV